MTHEQLAKRIEAARDFWDIADLRSELDAVNPKLSGIDPTSIDAVEKLRQELLPDWFVVVRVHGDTAECDMILEISSGNSKIVNSEAPTEAAARLAALVRALGKE